MVWHGLAECLLTVVPLVNLGRLKTGLLRRIAPRWAQMRGTRATPTQQCGICSALPAMLPMRGDCGHVFCYFCIASERVEHPRGPACPQCGATITTFDHAS